MERIVCKFGGTSVASAAQLDRVRNIIDAEPARRFVVVSAPGKREKSEAKITDLLYLCHRTAKFGADFSAPFKTIEERFLGIEKDLGLSVGIGDALAEVRAALLAGCTRDYAASRGEHLNGRIAAAMLGAEFIEPQEFVRILSSGVVDASSYEKLGEALAEAGKRFVVPGFYGRDGKGDVRTFSRGGSDITGAIVARAVKADLYENWTDVSGLLMTDPRLVDAPRPMAEVTYRELRELAYMGASVLHDEAILPVREVGIPINIRNTNAPEHPGTRIVSELSPEEDQSTQIAGIAGKKGFSMICVEKSLMNKEVGFGYRLLGVFERRGISIEHCPSSIDGMNVIVETAQLGEDADEILEEIRRTLQPDRVYLEQELALVAVVGEGMKHTIGISARVFTALMKASVNVSVINQGASEVNIIVGIVPDHFEKAVQAIYAEFIH